MSRTHRSILLILLAAATALPSCGPADTRPFTVVLLPDTQNYSEKFPAGFHAQTQWIRENAAVENIVFVTQVGDIVNRGGEGPEQWKVADAAMSRLDGVVPWGVAIGNHDYDQFEKQTSSTFAKYFGPQRFAGRPWYGGGTDDGQCSYQFFQGGGRRFMVLHLPFEGNDKALAWARDVIGRHPGVPTIVSTHSYLRPASWGPTPFHASEFPGRSGPKEMKEKLIDKCPQIFLVVSGHWPIDRPTHRTDTNEAGGKVISLMADFQNFPEGGQGWLVLLTFDPAKDSIGVRTCSPVLQKDLPRPEGNFTLPSPLLPGNPQRAASRG